MKCNYPIKIGNYSYGCGRCYACRVNFRKSKRSLYKRFKQFIKKASKECFR